MVKNFGTADCRKLKFGGWIGPDKASGMNTGLDRMVPKCICGEKLLNSLL